MTAAEALVARAGRREGSDLDLAVQGIGPDELGPAAAEASELAGIPVELFALEDLPPAFARRILEEGSALL